MLQRSTRSTLARATLQTLDELDAIERQGRQEVVQKVRGAGILGNMQDGLCPQKFPALDQKSERRFDSHVLPDAQGSQPDQRQTV